MLSEIQNFYRNKTVFVTGGTGFMGIGGANNPISLGGAECVAYACYHPECYLVQALLGPLEKLLRVTEVKRIYLLMRPKNGKSVEERLNHAFQNAFFDKLRETCSMPIERVKPILGDCNLVNLGISAEDRKILIDEVNVVMHLAATVRFDETLCKALSINVRGTLDLLQLAKEMQQLEAFVHVSSAFANCVVQYIEEKYYNQILGIGAVKMCDMANTLGVDITNKLADVLCKAYQNTYTFTKSLAEEAILSEGRSLPISIFRPAIVIQTHSEPISGWIGNYYGPSAALYACGRGVLRVMYMRKDYRAHLVPADYCANLMLAIGWETAKSRPKQRLQMAPPIYNYSNDDDNPLHWKDYMNSVAENSYLIPLTKMIWFPFMITVGQKWLYYPLIFFYHTIPGYLIDFLLMLKGKKTRMTKLYRTIHRQSEPLDYFLTTQFKFTMDNTKSLWNTLTAKDKELFNFDIRSIRWKDYIHVTLCGMRLHLGREGPETLPKAKLIYKKFLFLHRLSKLLLCAILVSLVWTLYKRLFL